MTKLNRRQLLAASAAATHFPLPALAQGKPEKLVYVGDNGPWHFVLVEEVAPAFEKATGIKIDFTLLPVDPWTARLKAELSGGSSGIDIVQWSVGMAGWISPHMMDHDALANEIMAKDPSWDWPDFLGGSKRAATYDGKMAGIPYRITTGIMHYQKALLEQAGIAKLPETFDELRKAAIATNKPPERYGYGICGRQGSAILSSFMPFLYSCGGDVLDFKTGEILINKPNAVAALDFWAGLVTKDKVVPPEAMTWEYDEIVAGGQTDRYAMTETFAPYGTLMNDPKLSKTGGKWVWSTVPGPDQQGAGPHLGRRPLPRHPEIHPEQGLGAGLHPDGLQQGLDAPLHDPRQRAPPRLRPARPGDGAADRLAAHRRRGDRDRHSHPRPTGLEHPAAIPPHRPVPGHPRAKRPPNRRWTMSP